MLVYQPDLLFLDQPFSNFDAKLRERARVWFQALQRRLNLTTVFVTHDQDEAVSMSDRILVMDSGGIAHEGTPEEVYRNPSTPFVADFVGQCNLIDAVVEKLGNGCLVPLGSGVRFSVEVDPAPFAAGAHVTLVLRPEDIYVGSLSMPNGKENLFPATLESSSFYADHFRSEVVIGEYRLVVLSRTRPADASVAVEIDPRKIDVPRPAGWSKQ